MAETFPIGGWAYIGIKPGTGFSYARETSGLLVSSRGGRQAYWRGQLRTDKLDRVEYANLHAVLWNAVEKNLRFDFVHPRFACPRSYTPGTWPLLAVPAIAAVTDLYTLSVAGLEIGMQLKRGDRFTIHQDELRCHRIISADVTVISETAQALPLTPRLPIGVFAVAAAVHFINPVLRVAVLEDSIDMPEEYQQTPASFEVMESLA